MSNPPRGAYYSVASDVYPNFPGQPVVRYAGPQPPHVHSSHSSASLGYSTGQWSQGHSYFYESPAAPPPQVMEYRYVVPMSTPDDRFAAAGSSSFYTGYTPPSFPG